MYMNRHRNTNLANDWTQHPPYPGDGGAGADGRVPDGGGEELGGVHVLHIGCSRHSELGTEGEECEERRAGSEECGNDTADPGHELSDEEQRFPAPDIDNQRQDEIGWDLYQ